MIDRKPNWTSFRKRIFIKKPLKDVYDAWAVTNNLTSWFLEKAEYTTPSGNKRPADERIEEGDIHSWKWFNWDFREEGKVLTANGGNKISFTFGNGGNVHINLTAIEHGTEVELIQNEIPDDEESIMNYYVGCSNGWTFWLTNLKAWLEYGITLNATGVSQDETKDLVNS